MVFQLPSLALPVTTATQKGLARQVKYLKVENEVLRGKLPGRITITPKERQRLQVRPEAGQSAASAGHDRQAEHASGLDSGGEEAAE